MTAPEPRANGLDANTRGIIVLVAAVAVGLLLLLKAGGGGGSTKVSAGKEGSSTPGTTAELGGTTTSGLATTTTTGGSSSAHQPAEVKVLVLNGSGKAGVAKSTKATIGTKGYTMLTENNAAANASTTSVYFAEGYEEDAKTVAGILGKDSSIVTAKPATPLGPGSDSANVVVVLGADTPAASTTSTTAAGSTGSTTSTTSG